VLKLLRRLFTLKQRATAISQSPGFTVKAVKTNEPLQLHEGNDSEFNSPHIQTTNVENVEPGLLTEAQIHSDKILRLPFTKWTLSSLNAASSTLTKFSLKMTVEANVTWKTFS
jgi:hypothetical protein